MVYGVWFMVYGLWGMVYGLWYVCYVFIMLLVMYDDLLGPQVTGYGLRV